MQTLKHIFIGWLATFIAIAAQAQNEQDFASRFMSLYAHQSTLQCTTVSPLMLERMMQLPDVEENDHTRQVLSQLKSIQMANNTLRTTPKQTAVCATTRKIHRGDGAFYEARPPLQINQPHG